MAPLHQVCHCFSPPVPLGAVTTAMTPSINSGNVTTSVIGKSLREGLATGEALGPHQETTALC